MEDQSIVKAVEVRRGLFFTAWAVPNTLAVRGTRTTKAQLCGSHSNHVFNFTFSFEPAGNKNKKSIKFTVGKASCKTDFGANDTSAGSSTTQPQQQQLTESKISDWQVDPLYMWCFWETVLTIHHLKKEKNSVDWKVSLIDDLVGEEIILWMDFGTNTVAEDKILNGLAEMFNNQTNCDVQFQFKNAQNVGAHVNILSAGSPVFAAMLQSGLYVESQSRKVVIDDIDPEIFKQLLIFLYSGKAPRLTEKNISQPLYEVADKYGVVLLKNDCVEVLQEQLSIDNAIDVLVWSDFFRIPNLFESAMQFLLDNSRELCSQPQWVSFMKNHPELCLQANQRMAALLPPSKKRQAARSRV